MNKNTFLFSITSFVFVFLFSMPIGYTLVFAGPEVFGNDNSENDIDYVLSDNVYIDTNNLNNTMLIFNSKEDISNYKLFSECNIDYEFVENYKNLYLFEIEFLNGKCSDKGVSLLDNDNNILYTLKFNILSEYDIYSYLLDLKTEKLVLLEKNLDEKIKRYLKYEKYSRELNTGYFGYIQKKRILKELKYNFDIVKNIVKGRGNKYIMPVKGEKMPYNYSKLPNASRFYRSKYTDGIHQGWDIGNKFGDNVVSIDDGVIVRVISDFVFNDLDKIKFGNNLTHEDKLNNLDILRGNQVWLKTLKGDITVYSHLNKVNSDIVEGSIVKKGDNIGNIGITGVPDKNYKDYHLHIELYKNPYNEELAGKYSILDYMKWDWYFKGESMEFVLRNQSDIFNESYNKMGYVNSKK